MKKNIIGFIVFILLIISPILPAKINDIEDINLFEPLTLVETSSGLTPILENEQIFSAIKEEKQETWYAYRVSPDPEGPCYFVSYNPGDLEFLAPTESSSFISGGCWADGLWYCVEYTKGRLWVINEDNGDMIKIGGGVSDLNGLAFDPGTGIMYGTSSYNLYEIDMETRRTKHDRQLGNKLSHDCNSHF